MTEYTSVCGDNPVHGGTIAVTAADRIISKQVKCQVGIFLSSVGRGNKEGKYSGIYSEKRQWR